jgi:TonB family protein
MTPRMLKSLVAVRLSSMLLWLRPLLTDIRKETALKTAAKYIAFLVVLTKAPFVTGLQAQQDVTVKDSDMTVSEFEDIGYPPLARQTRTQGVVVVRVRLDKDGKVTDAVALSGSEYLTSASVANAKKWRFQPNAQRAAILVYNFRTPHAACNSKTVLSFSMLQAPNFVSITGCEVPVQP